MSQIIQVVGGGVRIQIQICLNPQSVLFQEQAPAQYTRLARENLRLFSNQLVKKQNHTHTHKPQATKKSITLIRRFLIIQSAFPQGKHSPETWKDKRTTPHFLQLHLPKKFKLLYHIAALISHASKGALKTLQARLQQYMNRELPEVQAGLEKAEEPEIKLPASVGSQKKQGNSRKTSTYAPLTMLRSLTVWITTN